MRIGFVSTWFERGAAYVTKQYISLLQSKNDVFVYARGGEKYAIGDEEWDKEYVTWGKHIGYVDEISWRDIKKWIKKNNLEIIFFNEQRDIDILIKIKLSFPNIKIGSYIDYYRQDTIESFKIYDFLICNTKRHYDVFKWHPQSYYVPWGTDIELYSYKERKKDNIIKFFHSAGMSTRKGTSKLIDTFLKSDFKFDSKLIIHTQLPISKFTELDKKTLEKNNIQVIEKTVSAPGLYYLADVYVYPTELDGLGLTIYEALSSGLPVIGTDVAPINEIIDNNLGKLVKVKKQFCRSDAYYWPLSIIDEKSLNKCMKYYIDNKKEIIKLKENAREVAINKYNWNDRSDEINNIFISSKILENALSKEELISMKKNIKLKKLYKLIKDTSELLKLTFVNRLIFKVLKKYNN